MRKTPRVVKDSDTYQLKRHHEKRTKSKKCVKLLPPIPTAKVSIKIPESTLASVTDFAYLKTVGNAFVEAAMLNDTELIKVLIGKGQNVNHIHTVLGCSALHASASLEDPELIELLICSGADIHQTAESGRIDTALKIATVSGNATAVQLLMEAGAHSMNLTTPKMLANEFRREKLELVLDKVPNVPCRFRAVEVFHDHVVMGWDKVADKKLPYCDPRADGIDASTWNHHVYYKLKWKETGTNDIQHLKTNELCANVYSLRPATEYQLTITACNAVGDGEPSCVLTVKTHANVPSMPTLIMVLFVECPEAKLEFEQPDENGSYVDYGMIQLQSKGSYLDNHANAINMIGPSPIESKWETIWEGDIMELDGACSMDAGAGIRYQYTIKNILPGHAYYVRLRLRNEIGWSPYGNLPYPICTNSGPQPIDIMARSVTLIWSKPYNYIQVESYILEYKLAIDWKWTEAHSNVKTQSFTVHNLDPVSRYMFHTMAYSESNGRQPEHEAVPSDIVRTTRDVPEFPFAFDISNCDCNNITVSWESPRDNGSPLSNYEIQFCLVGKLPEDSTLYINDVQEQDWICQDQNLDKELQTYTFANLQIGAYYWFRLRARNNMGWSPFATTRTAIRTHDVLPPTVPALVSRTRHSITISWTVKMMIDDVAEYFEAQVRNDTELSNQGIIPRNDEYWTTISNTIMENSVECQNLDALSWYSFRVRYYGKRTKWGRFSDISISIQTRRRL